MAARIPGIPGHLWRFRLTVAWFVFVAVTAVLLAVFL